MTHEEYIMDTTEQESHIADGAAEKQLSEAVRSTDETAARFRRNMRMLCAGSVNVVPFDNGAPDDR